MTYTRQDYMNGKCNHKTYYEQFVTPNVLTKVQSSIGLDRLLKSKDPHFNDIYLGAWDKLASYFHQECREIFKTTGGYPCLADGACIGKAAARLLIKDLKEPYQGWSNEHTWAAAAVIDNESKLLNEALNAVKSNLELPGRAEFEIDRIVYRNKERIFAFADFIDWTTARSKEPDYGWVNNSELFHHYLKRGLSDEHYAR
jgi:hypothetical protein